MRPNTARFRSSRLNRPCRGACHASRVIHRAREPHAPTIEPIHNHLTEIRTWILSLRLWVVELLACVAEWTGSRELRLLARGELRHARRVTRQAVFLLAFAQMRLPHWNARTPRGPNIKHGFRRRLRRNRFCRHVTRDLRLRTLEEVRAALDDVDRLAARAAKRVRWLRYLYRFTPVAPPAPVRVSAALRPAPDAADTS